jgi:hypothetical protein
MWMIPTVAKVLISINRSYDFGLPFGIHHVLLAYSRGLSFADELMLYVKDEDWSRVFRPHTQETGLQVMIQLLCALSLPDPLSLLVCHLSKINPCYLSGAIDVRDATGRRVSLVVSDAIEIWELRKWPHVKSTMDLLFAMEENLCEYYNEVDSYLLALQQPLLPPLWRFVSAYVFT